MVDVSATVESKGWGQLDQLGGVALCLGLLQLLLSCVQVVDVGLVVLLVVQLHDLATYDGLQGGIIVGELGKRVLAAHQLAEMIYFMYSCISSSSGPPLYIIIVVIAIYVIGRAGIDFHHSYPSNRVLTQLSELFCVLQTSRRNIRLYKREMLCSRRKTYKTGTYVLLYAF